MNIFTDIYENASNVVQTDKFDSSWQDICNELKNLLLADGPAKDKGEVLEKLRSKLDDSLRFWQFSQSATAKEIVKASSPKIRNFQERAALIKTMKHFYMANKRGGQVVWVMDSPSKYSQWAFDELDGLGEESLKDALGHNSEVFGKGNRKMMAEALQHCRKWSSQIEAALSTASDKTKTIVRRWFHTESDTEEDVNSTINTLLYGFKKIHASCNSNQVIYSDRPHLRASGEYENVYASVNSGDAMPVIYIYELFLNTGKRTFFGNIPKMWLCALTVIHELSHKVANTDDTEGLKPGIGFTSSQALKNADSWAYFAADIVGALSATTIQNTLK